LPRSRKALHTLWRSAGARTIEMKPEIHDILVAQTSHLPHVLAGAFVQLVQSLQKKDPNTSKLLAGSFRDVTRIADSEPRQWAEISRANQKFLVGALKSYRDIVNRVVQRVEASADGLSEWEEFFSSARKSRKTLLSQNYSN